MVKQQSQDPIETAVAVTGTRQFKARLRRAHQDSWRARERMATIDREKVDAWREAQRCARRAFRAEFRGAKWQGLSIYFSRSADFTTNYSTFATLAYMEYTATWEGLTVSRTMRPTCLEDVKAEAWRLAGALLGWKEVEVSRG